MDCCFLTQSFKQKYVCTREFIGIFTRSGLIQLWLLRLIRISESFQLRNLSIICKKQFFCFFFVEVQMRAALYNIKFVKLTPKKVNDIFSWHQANYLVLKRSLIPLSIWYNIKNILDFWLYNVLQLNLNHPKYVMSFCTSIKNINIDKIM